MGVQDDIRRFENEVFLANPLTGFGSRHNLIEDLTAALVPESSPRVVAVFDLAGWKDYRRVYGERESDVLIARLAEHSARLTERFSADPPDHLLELRPAEGA